MPQLYLTSDRLGAIGCIYQATSPLTYLFSSLRATILGGLFLFIDSSYVRNVWMDGECQATELLS